MYDCLVKTFVEYVTWDDEVALTNYECQVGMLTDDNKKLLAAFLSAIIGGMNTDKPMSNRWRHCISILKQNVYSF
jgi:hypothetical protein